jgi:hypothetical protein
MAAPTEIPLDVPRADAVEQASGLVPQADVPPPPAPEVPDGDAAEQATDLRPDGIWPPRLGDSAEADEYDAMEQSQVVEEGGEEEYR